MLKTGFLTKYFGENKDIQHFAVWLLLNKKRQIAQELNKVVTVLGENFKAQDIIDKLRIKHDLSYKTKWETQNTEHVDGIYGSDLFFDWKGVLIFASGIFFLFFFLLISKFF